MQPSSANRAPIPVRPQAYTRARAPCPQGTTMPSKRSTTVPSVLQTTACSRSRTRQTLYRCATAQPTPVGIPHCSLPLDPAARQHSNLLPRPKTGSSPPVRPPADPPSTTSRSAQTRAHPPASAWPTRAPDPTCTRALPPLTPLLGPPARAAPVTAVLAQPGETRSVQLPHARMHGRPPCPAAIPGAQQTQHLVTVSVRGF